MFNNHQQNYPFNTMNQQGFTNQGIANQFNVLHDTGNVMPHQMPNPFGFQQQNQQSAWNMNSGSFGNNANTGFGMNPPPNPTRQAVRPPSTQTMNDLRSAIWANIGQTASLRVGVVDAVNNRLTQENGNSKLMQGLVLVGAIFIENCMLPRGVPYQQAVSDVAAYTHAAQLTRELRMYPYQMQQHPHLMEQLEALTKQYDVIAYEVGRLTGTVTTPVPQQNVYQGPKDFQGTDAALNARGVQPQQIHQREIAPDNDVAYSMFDNFPKLPGMENLRVGTVPYRTMRMPDGTTMELGKARRMMQAERERKEREEQQANQTPAQTPTTQPEAQLPKSAYPNATDDWDISKLSVPDHLAHQHRMGSTKPKANSSPMPIWSNTSKLPHELTTAEITRGGAAGYTQISQSNEEGTEEIPITFKLPKYREPARNAVDDLFDEAFGAPNLDNPPQWGMVEEKPANNWHRWGLDKLNEEEGISNESTPKLDREALARKGIVSVGQASPGFDESPLADIEDTHTAQFYNDDAVKSGKVEVMESKAAAAARMFPGTEGLSLMDMVKLGNPQSPVAAQPTPVDVPVTSHNVMADEEREELATMDIERKQRVLNTKEHRGIAPVYIAGRQRPVLIKSLGGGRIALEGNNVNYEIHETELLGPQTVPMTGRSGDIGLAQSILTNALTSVPESHYRKILDDKANEATDVTDLLVDGPMLEMSGFIKSEGVERHANEAIAVLHQRLGERASEVDLDASINFNAFTPGNIVLSEEGYNAAIMIARAKTAATIVARAQEFFDLTLLPKREANRLHKAMTEEVNRLLQITFHPDYSITSFIVDLEDLSTLLHENEEEDVRDRLAAIYSQAAKTVFSVYTHASLKKRLDDVEESTGLTEDSEVGIFAEVTNVTLLPFCYADYPLAFEGAIGRVTKDNLPKLYEVLEGVLTTRMAEGVNKFIVLTEDHQIIEFFKPVVESDKSIYIARA